MPVNFAPSADDLLRFSPELILSIAGTVLMILDPLFALRLPRLFGNLSVLALILALFGAVAAFSVPGAAFSNLLVVDGFATFSGSWLSALACSRFFPPIAISTARRRRRASIMPCFCSRSQVSASWYPQMISS